METKTFGRKFVDVIFGNAQIVALFFVFLVVGGAFAFVTSKPQGFPDVSINIALVTTVYPGATAGQVEDQVVRPIEEVVADIKSVTEYSSTASDSFAITVVTFDEGTDINDGLRDLSAKLSRVELPEDATEPQVSDVVADAGFDFLVAVVGGADAFDLYTKANLAKEQIEGMSGVAKVKLTNPISPRVSIVLDDAKMREAGVSRAQVEGLLKTVQLDLPVGSFVDEAGNKVNVGVAKRLSSLSEIGETFITPTVKLVDIADIRMEMANDDQYNRVGIPASDEWVVGQPLNVTRSLMLAVSAKDSTDILDLAERLDDKYAELAKDTGVAGGVKVVNLYSVADSTREQINEIKAGVLGEHIDDWGPLGVLGYLFGGIVLVVLFLLIFINWRVALLAALSIPLALAVTALYLKLIGVQFDTIVLFSMVLVVGLVVDPTIVYLEALQRYRKQGFSAREAAAKTIDSVGVGVALSAIANFVVFVPFGVVSGFFGQIISHIPITVIPALVASVVVPAVFFLPVASRWLKPGRGVSVEAEQELVGAWRFSKWLGRAITNLLAPGFGRKVVRVVFVLLAVAAPIAVAGGLVATKSIEFVQFSSQSDSDAMFLYGTLNSSWDFDKAVQVVSPIQEYLAKQPEIRSFSYYQQDGNSFTLLASLWPMDERRAEKLRTSTELADDLNAYFVTLKDIELEAVTEGAGPPSERFPVKIRVFDPDINKLVVAANDVRKYLATKSEVVKVDDSLASSANTVSGTSLVLDSSDTAALNPFTIVGSIKNRLDETHVTTLSVGDIDWEVVTTVTPAIKSIDDIKEIELPSATPQPSSLVGPFGLIGQPSLVADVITGTDQQTAKTIQRLNGKRYVEIRARIKDDADPIALQADLNDYLNADKLKALGLATDATESKGEADSIAKSFTELLVALVIALFLIYVLLVAFFRSLISPLIIMFAIPLGLIGGLPAVAIATGQLGFLELLGVVAMAGIVVNVTILIIDFANQLRREGRTVQDAIATSVAVRYKAIFLTKATIFGGLMPLVIFSPFWRGLAAVMIFGIIVSGILSLFTTPILYVWAQALGGAFRKKASPKVVKPPVAPEQSLPTPPVVPVQAPVASQPPVVPQPPAAPQSTPYQQMDQEKFQEVLKSLEL